METPFLRPKTYMYIPFVGAKTYIYLASHIAYCSIKLQVSFAKEPYKRDYIHQNHNVCISVLNYRSLS